MASYDLAWDATLRQRLVDQHGEVLAEEISLLKAEDTRENLQTMTPRSTGTVHTKSEKKAGPPKAAAVAKRWLFHYYMGDVEHSLSPPSYAAGLDVDGSGWLDSSELSDLAASVMPHPPRLHGVETCESPPASPCPGQALDDPALLELLDTNGDDKVDYNEFDEFVARHIFDGT